MKCTTCKTPLSNSYYVVSPSKLCYCVTCYNLMEESELEEFIIDPTKEGDN